jgi:hypothetical protein
MKIKNGKGTSNPFNAYPMGTFEIKIPSRTRLNPMVNPMIEGENVSARTNPPKNNNLARASR